jgi:hypothetical protein
MEQYGVMFRDLRPMITSRIRGRPEARKLTGRIYGLRQKVKDRIDNRQLREALLAAEDLDLAVGELEAHLRWMIQQEEQNRPKNVIGWLDKPPTP